MKVGCFPALGSWAMLPAVSLGSWAANDACVAGGRLTGLTLNGIAFDAAVTPLLGWRGAFGLTAIFHARKNSGTFILL
jgi:hypothetical protein